MDSQIRPKAKALHVGKYRVEKDVDIPTLTNGYPLNALKVGDVLKAPLYEAKKLRNASAYYGRCTGRKHKTKTVRNELWVWRVK